jgi:hypothetical protein
MSSCYLVDMFEDSIDGIYDTLKECANIQVGASGCRSQRARTRRHQGNQRRVRRDRPMAQVFKLHRRWVNQGGKRKGRSLCIWNRGMLISCRSWTSGGTAAPAKSHRDLFLALWLDLFMRRVESGGDWSLFVRTRLLAD